MAPIQKLILLTAVGLFSVGAHGADWGVAIGTMGFQGERHAAVAVDWWKTHAVELGFGRYRYQDERKTQVNLLYRFTPATVQFYEQTWAPVSVGLMAVYAPDQENYFLRSPGKYPEDGYYEQTGIRLGLELSTQLMFWNDRLRVLYSVSLMDTGVAAWINNDHRYIRHFLSSGLSLRFFF